MPDPKAFADFYAADDEVMSALAANDMEAYAKASGKLDAALSRIKDLPPAVPSSWKDD